MDGRGVEDRLAAGQWRASSQVTQARKNKHKHASACSACVHPGTSSHNKHAQPAANKQAYTQATRHSTCLDLDNGGRRLKVCAQQMDTGWGERDCTGGAESGGGRARIGSNVDCCCVRDAGRGYEQKMCLVWRSIDLVGARLLVLFFSLVLFCLVFFSRPVPSV